MRFNARFRDIRFTVDISDDLSLGFPDYEPEYDMAIAAFGGTATPVDDFSAAWFDRPVVVIVSFLGLPWEVLAVSALGWVEHAWQTYAPAYDHAPHRKYEDLHRTAQEALELVRSTLCQQQALVADYVPDGAAKLIRHLHGIGNALAGSARYYTPNQHLASAGSNMAWAISCLLSHLTCERTTPAILGASKARSAVQDIALHLGADAAQAYTQEMDWQIHHAMGVVRAFRDVESETAEGQRVDLARVLSRP